MSGEAVIATFISFAVGTIVLFYCLGENRLMGQFVRHPFTTLVEINWWDTRCSCGVHNGFTLHLS